MLHHSTGALGLRGSTQVYHSHPAIWGRSPSSRRAVFPSCPPRALQPVNALSEEGQPLRVLLPGSTPKLEFIIPRPCRVSSDIRLRRAKFAAQAKLRLWRSEIRLTPSYGAPSPPRGGFHSPQGAYLNPASAGFSPPKVDFACIANLARAKRGFHFLLPGLLAIFHLTLAVNICKMGAWKIAGENRMG